MIAFIFHAIQVFEFIFYLLNEYAYIIKLFDLTKENVFSVDIE